MPPVILVLDPGGVGVANHHDGEEVRSSNEIGRQVELRRQPRILAHPDEVAVAPDDRNTLSPTQMQHHVSTPPGSRDGEGRAVETGGVLGWGKRSIDIGPRHDDVRVVREIAGVLARPTAGNLDRAPAGVIGRRLSPAVRRSSGSFDQLEPPGTIERAAPWGANARPSGRRVGIGLKRGAAGKPVDLRQFGLQQGSNIEQAVSRHNAIMALPPSPTGSE